MRDEIQADPRRFRALWRLSPHAEVRAQQRGAPVRVIEFLAEHGVVLDHQAEGRRRIGVTRRLAARLHEDGHSPDLIDRARRKNLVLADDGTVVTVLCVAPTRVQERRASRRGRHVGWRNGRVGRTHV